MLTCTDPQLFNAEILCGQPLKTEKKWQKEERERVIMGFWESERELLQRCCWWCCCPCLAEEEEEYVRVGTVW